MLTEEIKKDLLKYIILIFICGGTEKSSRVVSLFLGFKLSILKTGVITMTLQNLVHVVRFCDI